MIGQVERQRNLDEKKGNKMSKKDIEEVTTKNGNERGKVRRVELSGLVSTQEFEIHGRKEIMRYPILISFSDSDTNLVFHLQF